MEPSLPPCKLSGVEYIFHSQDENLASVTLDDKVPTIGTTFLSQFTNLTHLNVV